MKLTTDADYPELAVIEPEAVTITGSPSVSALRLAVVLAYRQLRVAQADVRACEQALANREARQC